MYCIVLSDAKGLISVDVVAALREEVYVSSSTSSRPWPMCQAAAATACTAQYWSETRRAPVLLQTDH